MQVCIGSNWSPHDPSHTPQLLPPLRRRGLALAHSPMPTAAAAPLSETCACESAARNYFDREHDLQAGLIEQQQQ